MDPEALVDLFEQPAVIQVMGIAGLALVCLAAQFVSRRFIVRGIEKLVLSSSTDWDDVLQQAQVFERLAALVPAVIGWYGIRLLPGVGDEVEAVVGRVAFSVIILVVTRAILAFLTGANEIHARQPENWSRPIKGYVQVVKIIVAIVAAILILATLLDRSPAIFLSGLGAMTAILLLIFRDTILSLVASIQITGNDMVRRGDWIEMPAFGADGDVIDVALHTVKVQNWDKTVTTIPTHKLISDSFKNWRYMSLSGGRRIKRALAIDMASVRFLTEEELARFSRSALLADYIAGKREDIERWNTGRDPDVDADVRRLTNLGTFRAYIQRYLAAHPDIHQGMTLLVRQLAPGEAGIPIEVYCFPTTTDWNAYEAIQADSFDHLVSVTSEFGLRAFQIPSGTDFRALVRED